MSNWDNQAILHSMEAQTSSKPVVPCFDIAVSFEALRSIWQRQAENRDVYISTHIDPELPARLQIDGLKLQHCLNNLVANAIQHSGNSVLQIVAARHKTGQASDFLLLGVQDNGRGMSSEEMETLFLRAVPIDTEAKTFGYVDTGLPITQELISELGGQIKVSSHLGLGSLFALVLPLSESDTSTSDATPQTNDRRKTDLPPVNLLVVDDYNLNQLTIKTMLHEHKGKVYCATNGYEALEILQSCPVDIILMDIHMPQLDGIETTMKIRESREKFADVTIVAMTADPQYQHADLCRKIGMNDAMAKPIRKQDLLHLIREHTDDYKMAV